MKEKETNKRKNEKEKKNTNKMYGETKNERKHV